MAGTNFVSIETDISEPLQLFEEMGGKRSRLMRNILAGVGSKAKNLAKREYRGILTKQTGHLYDTINRKVTRNGQAVVVTAHDRKDKVRYGFVLARGTTILPHNSRNLVLKDKLTGNVLRRVRMVTIEPHDFIEGPVLKYLNSGEFKSYIDKATQKQIDKLEKKLAKGVNK